MLEQQLADTKRQLAELTGELGSGAREPREDSGDIDEEPKASLAARALSVYQKNKGKPMTAEQVATALRIASSDVNRLRTELTRLHDRGKIARHKRGVYVLTDK